MESTFILYIDVLIVVDSTIYQWFQEIYSMMPYSLITNYMKIFFSNLVNGVNQFLNDFIHINEHLMFFRSIYDLKIP